MSPEALQAALATRPLWALTADDTRIERKLVAKNFKGAFAFLEQVWTQFSRALASHLRGFRTSPECRAPPQCNARACAR
jgi:pterin-4a-carbinolamine dehydratase